MAGGLWKKPALREKGETVVYENLLTNTSKEKMALSDYPMPAEWPTYPTAEQVLPGACFLLPVLFVHADDKYFVSADSVHSLSQ